LATAQQLLFDVDFNDAVVDEAPPRERFDPQATNTRVQTLNEAGTNVVRVVGSLGALDDQPLMLDKAEPTPRTPEVRLVQRSGGIAQSVVQIDLDVMIDYFEASPRFPGFETLLSLNLINNAGQTFYHLGMRTTDEEGRRGSFTSSAYNGGAGRWQLGEVAHVTLWVDLGSGASRLAVDGQTIHQHDADAEVAGSAIRIIQLRDGTAYGAYDGLFTAGLDNLQVRVLDQMPAEEAD
jgi:hypothetical protein